MAGPPPLFPTIPAGLWQQPRDSHPGLWQTTDGRLRMMVAFLEMHKLPAFPWRNLFTGHNTNRPYSHGGSVNKALTDNEVCSLAPGSGGRSCTLRLENSFQAGDGRALTVVGDARTRDEDAVGLACKVALAILLQRGPEKVWLLEKAWQLPDSRTFVQQLAALLWEDDDGRGLAADSPERDYLLSQVELQLRERGFGGLLDHPLAIGADRFPSAPQPPQPAAGGMQQLPCKSPPLKAPPPQRSPPFKVPPPQQQQVATVRPRSGHFVAGVQVKCKGKGLSSLNIYGWAVLMQVQVNAQNGDPEPEVEVSDGLTRLLINTANHSIDIQADLQQNSEHLTVTVEDWPPQLQRDSEGSSPQDEGR